ncbi:MAG: indole-3-glycerol phosphate synthase TrpC [Candidatus Marinimicrobia bacterium]|nr:indole-3-glycerol phosphate synthase TrpC [Candidatus Neomarinimicrobiota bacterium]
MNKLEKIISDKREAVSRRMKEKSILRTRSDAEAMPPALDFRASLVNIATETRIIAEVKKSSPSADFGGNSLNVVDIAVSYERAGAAAISVLTEEYYFSGSMNDLRMIKASVDIPVLCKDFIIDPFQLYDARAAGADAILLIAAILDSYELPDFISICKTVGITPFVEVTDTSDIDKALNCDINWIGINCRDLKTFELDLKKIAELLPLIPDDFLVVAESGIKNSEDLNYINDLGIYAALIGSMFMKSDIPGRALEMLIGENHDKS